jgi:chromosome segregation ATPase
MRKEEDTWDAFETFRRRRLHDTCTLFDSRILRDNAVRAEQEAKALRQQMDLLKRQMGVLQKKIKKVQNKNRELEQSAKEMDKRPNKAEMHTATDKLLSSAPDQLAV